MSFARPDQIELCAAVCQSFALDNGAFSAWRRGLEMDTSGYYRWTEKWLKYPGCDFAVIPDVIDGSKEDNDALISEWPHGVLGVPVWHLHESLDRLLRLCKEWPKVALGSSGRWRTPGTADWWIRMGEAMQSVCDSDGMPMTKLHGLRMLNPSVFTRLPLSSADSSNVAVNSGSLKRWNTTYSPPSRGLRALILAERVEVFNSRPWVGEELDDV